jgi:hypothetical protein
VRLDHEESVRKARIKHSLEFLPGEGRVGSDQSCPSPVTKFRRSANSGNAKTGPACRRKISGYFPGVAEGGTCSLATAESFGL